MAGETPIRISYLIVTRNRAKYLEKTLANVREFISPADELIIVDGNSTDETAALIARNRDLVTVFVSEPDRSEGHAVNKAIARASGRFVKFVTDDDYIYPAAMIELAKVADENPTIDAFQCGGEYWDCQGDVPTFGGYREVRPGSVDTLSPAEFFWRTHHGLGLMVRRDVLVFVGGASAGYVSVDGDMICKLFEAGCRIAYLDICLYRWNIFVHSGVLKQAAISRDGVMFDIRLGNWGQALRQSPAVVASALGMPNIPNLEGFLRAVIVLDAIRASRAGWILNVFFRPIWPIGRAVRKLVRGSRRKSPASMQDAVAPPSAAGKPFTGALAILPVRSGR
jgi:glycosyltransferase involved in cell wall biosynthesis